MKNELLKNAVTEKIKELCEIYKDSIPPTGIVVTPDNGVIMMQFQNFDDKAEIAMTIASVAALLDAAAVIWVSEAWSVAIKDEKILKRFGDDRQKLNNWLRNKWPSLEDCPYRQESLVIAADDSQAPFMANIEIKRDKDKKLIWDTLINETYHDLHPEEKITWGETFNQLHQKAMVINEMINLSKTIPEEFRPNNKRVLEMVLENISNDSRLDFYYKPVADRAIKMANEVIENLKTKPVNNHTRH